MQIEILTRFMKSSRFMYIVVLTFAWVALLGAGSLKMGAEEMEVTGRVYVMGNEPFTVAAIELDNGKVYALVGEHEKELRMLRGKRVRVKGKMSKEKPRGAEAIDVISYELAGRK